MAERIIEFLRKKDLILVKELGEGACGKTVLLHDPVIEEDFVCKKFAPFSEPLRQELFSNFVREIKLLHLLNHPNVVRVFNYYLYPEQLAGYILMEFVEGLDVEEYLASYPEQADQIFSQIIDGFAHLEKHEILHRDLRPQNILVSNSGVTKIIDFGFGKKVATQSDFDKSVSLNWWCEPPDEFAQQTYNYTTEVYFVGKLFEKIIVEAGIEQFSYTSVLSKMGKRNPDDRIPSFSSIKQEILAGKISEIPFSESEREAYRNFADDLSLSLSKIESSTKYYSDADEVERKLEDAYRSVMLEEYAPQPTVILRCFINGTYYFSKSESVLVENLKRFLQLFRSCSRGKKDIILSNIHARLDAIPRYDEPVTFDDDIPF